MKRKRVRKVFVYYCSGCSRRIVRTVDDDPTDSGPVGRHRLKSWCGTAGRDVVMRLSKNQDPSI